MNRPTAVIVQSDNVSAATLAAALQTQCRSVHVTHSPDEARAAVPRHRADIVIADLELMRLPEIQLLHHEFGNVSIVCTHRIPDDHMWAEALQAGAVDCCRTSDVGAIMEAATRNLKMARSRAAA
jgi:DNA-binding NtrC family response regulator